MNITDTKIVEYAYATYQNVGCWIDCCNKLICVGVADDPNTQWVYEDSYAMEIIESMFKDRAVAVKMCKDWLTSQYEQYYDL